MQMKWGVAVCGSSGTTPPGRENKHKSPEAEISTACPRNSKKMSLAIRVVPSRLQCRCPTGKTLGAATGPPVPARPQGECLTWRKVRLRCLRDPPVDGTRGTLRSQPQAGPQSGTKMPSPARLASLKSEAFRAGEGYAPGPAPGCKGLRRNRGRFSHLCVTCPVEALPCSSSAASRPSDFRELNVFAFSQAPAASVLFAWTSLTHGCPKWKVPHSRCHRCHTWRLSAGPETQTNQDFPSPFPEIAARPAALILKTHFWKVGHKLRQVVLGLYHSCLSKQSYFLPGDFNGNYGFSEVGA